MPETPKNGSKLSGMLSHLRWILPTIASIVAVIFAMGAAYGAGRVESLEGRVAVCEEVSKDLAVETRALREATHELRLEIVTLQAETKALTNWLERHTTGAPHE